jgi:hypothetical protein
MVMKRFPKIVISITNDDIFHMDIDDRVTGDFSESGRLALISLRIDNQTAKFVKFIPIIPEILRVPGYHVVECMSIHSL